MELTTEAMKGLLPKLGELLKEEYGLQKGVKKKIESLSRELRVVHAVLRKIGDVPPDQLDEPVRLWMRDVREASYDMEDIVDAFLVHAGDQERTNPEPADPYMFKRLLNKVGELFKRARLRRKISNMIKEISDKLEEVAARRGRYTPDNIIVKPVAATTIDPRLLNLYKRATELVGIEGPRDDLINKLSLGVDVDVSNMKTKIISVVGFGGLGKTTLAKAAYDHLKPQFQYRASVPVDQNPDMNEAVDDQVIPHFECGAFVPMGRNPDLKKVFRDILIDLDKEKYRNSNIMMLDEKQLMDELKDFVKEKRCFIVIDDIWDKKSWEYIRCALQESNCGSRLVITTRIYEVATYAGEAYIIRPLSRDNSEKLLYARIIDGEGQYFDSPTTEACEKILKKCGGVPLAIITIASLLASKPEEDWSEVYNSIGFGHEDNDDVGNTRRILSFSYYDLPSHLKACLLYLSVFPEDDVIEKHSLIWKWIAEGFIPEEQASVLGLFVLGERYFNELINRNMIVPKETKYEGYIDACSIHDMVLDMIHSLSSNENFITVLDGDDNEQLKLPKSTARRVALQRVEEFNVGQLSMEKVRSLIARECGFGALCPSLPVLRVLDIVNCHVKAYHDECIVNHLGSLLHLRYLGLAYTYIFELPREVRYLKFLQTLDLWGSRIGELPEEVGLLTQLVCLRVDKRTRVPAGLIGKLTSLQELWIRLPPPPGAVNGPPPNYFRDDGFFDDDDDEDDGLGGNGVADAPTLDHVATTTQFVRELGLLRELRVLRTYIDVNSESIENALLESLGNLHNIQDLEIGGCSLDNGGMSDARFVCHRRLHYLRLECFVFCGLPTWIKSSHAPNLSYLYVQVLVVKEQDIEILARLPELRCLMLHSRDTKLVSIRICSEGHFPKLRILGIFGPCIWFDLPASKCNSNNRVPFTIMPSIESLEFAVHVRSLKDATQLGLHKMLCFESLGKSSLQRITVDVKCGGARFSEVEEVEAALVNAAVVHPKHPILKKKWQQVFDMVSPYQEVCMDMIRNPELINKAWLGDIVSSGDLQALCMRDQAASTSKVLRLLYTNNGKELLALSSSAVHKRWKWEHSDKNPRGKSTTSIPPQLWQPPENVPMTNNIIDVNSEEATACAAVSRNDSYLISGSGGRITLFNMRTFKVMTTFMPPPDVVTFLAFHPQDNNIIAIGRKDSSIHIYNIRMDEIKIILMGHQKKVTGLAFSQSMNVIVSSGADAQV